MKTPVVIRDNYVMYLEWFDGYLWFHTDVFKWTHSIKKEFIKDLKTLQSLLPLPLLALVKEEDTKLASFGNKVGWEKESNNMITMTNGSKAYIYKWSK